MRTEPQSSSHEATPLPAAIRALAGSGIGGVQETSSSREAPTPQTSRISYCLGLTTWQKSIFTLGKGWKFFLYDSFFPFGHTLQTLALFNQQLVVHLWVPSFPCLEERLAQKAPVGELRCLHTPRFVLLAQPLVAPRCRALRSKRKSSSQKSFLVFIRVDQVRSAPKTTDISILLAATSEVPRCKQERGVPMPVQKQ